MSNPVSGLSIDAPADFIAPGALVYDGGGGTARLVGEDHPLPVTQRPLPAPAPLTGTAGGSMTAGPLMATAGRPLMLRLWGSWTGTVIVRDSIDGGANRLPLTIGGQAWGSFTGNVNEEEVRTPSVSGQSFYLDIAIGSGTVNFWMGQ